jgi:hypothetical protein
MQDTKFRLGCINYSDHAANIRDCFTVSVVLKYLKHTGIMHSRFNFDVTLREKLSGFQTTICVLHRPLVPATFFFDLIILFIS